MLRVAPSFSEGDYVTDATSQPLTRMPGGWAAMSTPSGRWPVHGKSNLQLMIGQSLEAGWDGKTRLLARRPSVGFLVNKWSGCCVIWRQCLTPHAQPTRSNIKCMGRLTE